MNLVFVAIDTLRADHLSCYGYPKKTSPNIDALAARGTLFEKFYSVDNCTHPGFTAMFTGMFPESTGIVSHWTLVDLAENVPTMAEYFSRAGYQTAAIDNLFNGWLQSGHREYTWFRRAYEHYDYPKKDGFYQPSADCVALACDWLEKKAKSPFLLFLHVWNPHGPYNKAPKEFYKFYSESKDPCDPELDYMPPNVRSAQRRVFNMPITDPGYVVAAYDAEIAYTDHSLGMLFEKIDQLKIADDTVILITADHGELMAQPRLAVGRPWCFSHIGLTEENLHLPLIVAGGPVANTGRISERFQLVDIMPTLMEMFDLNQEMDLDGMSSMSAIRGEQLSGRDAIFVSENTYEKQRAVMKWPWKYMRFEESYNSMQRRSLYDLGKYPGEFINLADALPDVVKAMDDLMNEYVATVTKGRPDPLKEQDISYRFSPPKTTKY